MPSALPSPFTCRVCDLEHQEISLARGETAHCVRCGSILERSGHCGPHASLAFTLTGIILGVASLVLPLVTVSQLGNHRDSLIYTGAEALWKAEMAPLSLIVLFCGVVSPALLLLSLLGLLLSPLLGLAWPVPALRRAVDFLTDWAYPEVQLLALLVGFVKLADLVQIAARPGLWCYAGMSLAVVIAYRSFEFTKIEDDAPAIVRREARARLTP